MLPFSHVFTAMPGQWGRFIQPQPQFLLFVESSSKLDKLPVDVGPRKLFIKNIDYRVSELELKQIFEEFGEIEWIKMSLPKIPVDDVEPAPRHSFIHFKHSKDAAAAAKALNQFQLYDRKIHVKFDWSQKIRQCDLQEIQQTAPSLISRDPDLKKCQTCY